MLMLKLNKIFSDSNERDQYALKQFYILLFMNIQFTNLLRLIFPKNIVYIDHNCYQGFRDLRVLKGLWELWEPEEIQETKEQQDLLVHQGPQVPPLGHRRRHLQLMVHQLVLQVKLVRTFIIYQNHF